MIHLNEEAARCLLCYDAPCGEKVARAIRAARFDNLWTAVELFNQLSEEELVQGEKACIHYDKPIRIAELAKEVESQKSKVESTLRSLTATLQDRPEDCKTANAVRPSQSDCKTGTEALPSLEINFCDMVCENPFFLASSAICTNYEMVARALEAGWAGVFYKTITKGEIREVSPRFDAVRKEGTPFVGFRNMEQLSENPYTKDFDILRRLKENYPTKRIIASIMGQTEEEWIELAKMAEAAGCDAVELNFSCPQMKLTGLGSDIGQNSELVLFYTHFVTEAVKIPVIPKMTPNVKTLTTPALASFFGGAKGISAINTIKSITMSHESEVSGKITVSGYSGKAVKPIALRMVYEMADNPVLHKAGIEKHVDISGIGGIETWRDALEFIQLGCRNVQVCTAVMQYGNRIIDDLKLGLQTYMKHHGYNKLEEMVGKELPNFVRPSGLDRETMVYPKIDRDVCIGCGRCYVSCQDGGHQAISFGDDRKPQINGSKCVGCHLCRLVCPTGAIGLAKRVAKRSSR